MIQISSLLLVIAVTSSAQQFLERRNILEINDHSRIFLNAQEVQNFFEGDDDNDDNNNYHRGKRFTKKAKKCSSKKSSSRKDSCESAPIKAPIQAPITTGAPSRFPTPCPKEKFLIEKLSKITKNETILRDINTPQGKAFHWFLKSDDTNVCTYATIEQRYAMSTMYYSTEGDYWKENSGWLSNTSECTWSLVTCNRDNNLLIELQMNENNMSGQIMPEFSVLSSLKEIHFYNNTLSGLLPNLVGFQDLKTFDVESNNLEGPAFNDELSTLLSIENYMVSENRLSGEIPPSIGTLTTLQNLWITDKNNIRGSIPSTIGNLKNLQTLLLGENSITGSIPSEMGLLVNLKKLYVYKNQMTGTIPNSFAEIIVLEQLRLEHNFFNGTLPELNTGLLQDLRLQDNSFTGTLPETLEYAGKIRTMLAGNNSFRGKIPSIQSPSLRYLDIRNNKFSGEIPTSLFVSPINLTYVYIQDNELSGRIHPSLANATELVDFYASNNKLSGAIPDIPEDSLTALSELLLDNNNLTGSVPPSICNLRKAALEDLWIDCNEPASVECDMPNCCTKCFPA